MQEGRFLNIPKVILDKDFQDLIPIMSPDEKRGLEQSIVSEGCRDPLVLWEEILIDGHTRYEICTANGIEFKTVSVDLPTREAVKIWIITNQLSRRNLLPNQIRYLRGVRHNIEKGIPHGGVQNEPNPGRTSERLAEEYGVSASTIKRDAKFAEKISSLEPAERELKFRAKRSHGPAAKLSRLDRVKKVWLSLTYEEEAAFMTWAKLTYL